MITIDFRITREAKMALAWILTPLAVIVGSAAIAHGWDSSWIAPTQPVSAAKLKLILSEAETRLAALEGAKVPAGAVMAFDLDVCPPGWTTFAAAAGRSIVGVNAGGTLRPHVRGEQFGSETRTLTKAQMPAHDHGINGRRLAAWQASGGWNVGSGSSPEILTDVTGATEGSGASFDVVPPSVALLFCKKS